MIDECIEKRIFDTGVYHKGSQSRALKVTEQLSHLLSIAAKGIFIGHEEVTNAIDHHELAGFIAIHDRDYDIYKQVATTMSDKVEYLQGPTPYDIPVIGWSWRTDMPSPV